MSIPIESESRYTAEDIQVLEGLEAIRKRPGMYVGGTGLSALHHLVYECVDNSIDETMAGFATQVLVRLGVDGSCTVVDDGRGMPVDPMKSENAKIDGRPAVEVILTELHAGGKFDNNAYKVSGGLHGVGVKCVNALSAWTEVEVHKDGKSWGISFERGVLVKPLHKIKESGVVGSGTRMTFLPDPEIFPDTQFRAELLESRLRELSYLNPGVSIRFVDEHVSADGKQRDVTFRDQAGIAGYVRWLNETKVVQSSCISVTREDAPKGLRCDIALQYTDATAENLLAFGNNIRNPDGGTHVQGFKTALTRVINGYAKREGILKDLVPSGDDLREGLTVVISVKLPNPQFNNQTKEKLLNEEVEGYVSGALTEELTAWLDKNPREAKLICQRAILAAEAREAARKARELIKRKGALGDSALPQKLSDCSSDDVESTEIFIVEGDSAGGSAKGGRDHVHQAILPLRGKLLNVEKCRLDKVLAFEEIQTLIQALQCGIGADLDPAKLRYGRIIIMTDADVDGSHIRTLLLTFLFRQMFELVRQGRIYIAQPPLYQVIRGKSSKYVLNDRQMNDTLDELALKHSVFVVRDENGTTIRTLANDVLTKALRLLHRLDDLASVVQRRGIPFQKLLESRASDPDGLNRLPTHHLVWGGGDFLAWSEEAAHTEITRRGMILDELAAPIAPGVATLPTAANNGSAPARVVIASLRQMHETNELSRIFSQLLEYGIDITDYSLVQEESVTGEKLPSKYGWLLQSEKGESTLVETSSVGAILKTLHDCGRRGIEIKRFKGLGEMEPIQLWETTMDPARRTLLRVTIETAAEASNLFTVLMGEDVEQRRAYIEKHALEVKNLDV
ncbi:MAG: DNA gyrase subunit B [Phycisphaerales bacterium]|nr:DNA gyrase subunit B [Phycisphaerales bacterium]